MKSRRIVAATLAVTCLAAILVLAVRAAEPDPAALLKQADQLFDQKNYREAATTYEAMLKAAPKHEGWRRAAERIINCKLRLSLFDDALSAAENYIKLVKDTPYEARAERLTGNLYLLIPHWGTRAGGKFHRAQYLQGIRLWSEQHDKKQALAHMDRARDLYAKYDADPKALAVLPEDERKAWHDERIECLFDLANICSRFSIYENNGYYWFAFWGERDDTLAETAGEKDFDEYLRWQWTRKRPIGLRVSPDGKPLWPVTPGEYAANLPDDEKILYLLNEVRQLDKTPNREYTGLSYYRQGMLARARFGMDRLNRYAGSYYWSGTYPLKEQLQDFNPWDLKDNESLVLVGGQIRKVVLPKEFDVLSLLRVTAGDYGKCSVADQAQYAVGLYYQSRQQYKTAIGEYDKMPGQFPQSQWTRNGANQIVRIKAPRTRISPPGVQLSGDPATVRVSYRNVSKVWFVAREIDLLGFLREIRNQPVSADKGMPYFWSLRSWSGYFTYYYQSNYRDWVRKTAAKHVGKEVARWSEVVKDDGTHRYAEVTVQTPLKARGACLVYAYLGEPPADDARKTGTALLQLGTSRAVCVLTDLAIVEKTVKDGQLYFITDARSGAPVPEAKVEVLEVWSRWNQQKRKSDYFKAMHNLVTDENGFAVLKRAASHQGQLHTLVDAGKGRIAWGGMSYWNSYYPSRLRQGLFAYCITDRPVYRPEQTVRFKVWMRQMQNGILHNLPDHNATVTIYDPRGNKVQTYAKRTDQFAGFEGEFTLGAEPRLGVYRLYVHGRNYAGGQNFRVEEYKKPEFEVSVEPGKSHAKLGEKLTAKVKATYYFGGPVSEATVKYKVFREEYTHRYYFPGEWDWLYGPGYGWAWYSYDWFPWWSRMRCCWSPPVWWWGFYGRGAVNPVRELVKEGEGPIGHDGTLSVDIDTGPALKQHPDRDHRYVIKAEVRDASRRVITGQGAVVVTRQAYYAFVQSDRGYYVPNQEMLIRVRCLTPDNQPIQTQGMVTVSSVVFGGPDNAHISEKVVKSWKDSTDERGMLEFRLRYEKSGQLKIKFSAPDQWGGTVEGYGLVWVCGRDFDGKLYRFNDLELITDKRTYQPGETAHVMINTQRAGSYVLFSDDVDSNALISWRLLHLPDKHTVIDVPITRESQPNFFVEATTVSDAQVHQQSKRICVPPEKGIIKVAVDTDKPKYKPGETANLKITAKTIDGKPVQAQFTVSAFDKSVLYIQPEFTPEIARFFHGNLRYHYVRMYTNLTEMFSAWGSVDRPFQNLYPYPADWYGIWGPTVGDWRTVKDGELQTLGGMKEKGRQSGFAGNRRAAPAAKPELSSMDAVSASPAAPAAAGEAKARRKDTDREQTGADKRAAAEPAFAEAEVRQKFADTALWLTTLLTDADGVATTKFQMPENLTTWKINVWGMTKETRVGEADTSAITTKNLLVRLQAPRFFLEYDEVVISANVHNYLAKEKTARVSLDVPKDLLEMIGATPRTIDVKVPAGGETRVDWRVKVLKEGTAKLTVKALTDEESDAMAMTFPVLVHGMTKQVAETGSMRPQDEKKTLTVLLDVPQKLRPELTRLEVQFAPSLVGAMIDALPYCIYYPYGCTEQTMSRFLPCVLTLKTLQNMGVKLEDVRKVRGRLEEIRRIEKGEGFKYRGYAYSPIFNSGELDKMIKQSVSRITNMQHGDGGWGWWTQDSSSGYLTSYVLYALVTAQQCDVAIDANMIRRGMQFLKNWEENEMRQKWWGVHAQHAYVAYVLSLNKIKAAIQPAKDDKRPGDLIERLYTGRDQLGLYGKALLAMALANLGDMDRARIVLRNIMQYKEENPETQIAWFRTPRAGWWYWWNSDIEANAMVLRAIVRIDPKSDVAPRLVKWILNNRRNGYYWRSTRDTTMCIAAMSDFVVASGEGRPDYTLTLDFDNGASVKKVKIDKDTFFTCDNRFVLDGVAIGPGKHTLKITKDGPGALYFNSYLSYFTKEEHISAAGHELKVQRDYFKLEQIPFVVQVENAEGKKIPEKRLRYKRVPVKDGDTVKSGDIIQVELRVKSDNNYTYLCFEDMKPAGCEPVDVRSGGKGQEGFYSYMELRDEKVVFFIGSIQQGEHLLRYRLRAETPGLFHALPTKLFGMYVPELKANSDETVIKIVD